MSPPNSLPIIASLAVVGSFLICYAVQLVVTGRRPQHWKMVLGVAMVAMAVVLLVAGLRR